jgi:hypothetical protein
MDVRISKSFTVAAALHLEGKFLVNVYDFDISMLVYTDNMHEQNVAIERMNYFIEQSLEDSIIINSECVDAIQKYQDAGIKICMTPEEPFCQIVAMVVLQKLNAIMEGRIRVTDIDFGSGISAGVRFQLVSEMAEAMVSVKGWWTKPDMCITDVIKTKDNIVKLCDPKSWDRIGLSWKEPVDKDKE